MKPDRILKVSVDIYVKVPQTTSNVAIEGTVAEAVEHGMMVMADYTRYYDEVVWAAVPLSEGEVPTRILRAWEETDDLALEPKQP